jgi:hypothetical protein
MGKHASLESETFEPLVQESGTLSTGDQFPFVNNVMYSISFFDL